MGKYDLLMNLFNSVNKTRKLFFLYVFDFIYICFVNTSVPEKIFR